MKLFGIKGTINEFEIPILEEIVKASGSGTEAFLGYLNFLKNNGDKDFLSKKEYSSIQFFREYQENPKKILNNVYSNVAFSILKRINAGEKLSLILNDIINNRLTPYHEEKQKDLNNFEFNFFKRNSALGNQIKAKISLKNNQQHKPTQKKTKLFALAGLSHFSYNKDTQNIYLNKGVTELYNTLDSLADENPYAALIHEHPSVDTTKSTRIRGK